MVSKPAKLKPGQVWTIKDRYRCIITMDSEHVFYTTKFHAAGVHRCKTRTFRRWLYRYDAKRTQRYRHRSLTLTGEWPKQH